MTTKTPASLISGLDTTIAQANNVSNLLSGMVVSNPYSVPSRAFVNFGFEALVNAAADAKYPSFGPAAIHGRTTSNLNGVLGEVVQNNAVGNYSFPIGVLGYGRLESAGNQVFGGFFKADLYSAGTGTTEINTFNYNAAPNKTFPPNRSFGTTDTVPITLTVAAGGTYQSLIAIQLCQEGSVPTSYVCGIYADPTVITDYGIFLDATANSSPKSTAFLKNGLMTSDAHVMTLQNVNNSPVAGSMIFRCLAPNGVMLAGVQPDGKYFYANSNYGTAVGVAGAASVLPSNPTGYIKISVNGSTKHVPFYEPA